MVDLQKYRETSAFLAGLPGPEMRFLERIGTHAEFYAGEALCVAGEPAEQFFIVTAGRAFVEAPVTGREPVVVDSVGIGDIVGINWYFAPHEWGWTVRAGTDMTVFAFDAATVRQQCQTDERLQREILLQLSKALLRRVDRIRTTLVEVVRESPTIQLHH